MSNSATDPAGGPERIFTDLTDRQADGLACAICNTDYLTAPVPHVPVGRSLTSSQVFACIGDCVHTAKRAEARGVRLCHLTVPSARNSSRTAGRCRAVARLSRSRRSSRTARTPPVWWAIGRASSATVAAASMS